MYRVSDAFRHRPVFLTRCPLKKKGYVRIDSINSIEARFPTLSSLATADNAAAAGTTDGNRPANS